MKITWKKRNIVAKKISDPHSGCSSTGPPPGALVDLGYAYPADASTEAIQLVTSAGLVGGRTAGVAQL